MKKQKKHNLKKFYKKSILPSAALFLVFLAACIAVVTSVAITFEIYIVDKKITSMYENAGQWGRMISTDLKDNTLPNTVSSLAKYLGEKNDICITDENNQIYGCFGNTRPDFDGVQEEGFYVKGRIIPDYAPGNPASHSPELSVEELLPLMVRILDEDNIDNVGMQNESIFSADYWVEIPVQVDGYRLYYKDSLVLLREDAFYILVISIIEFVVLMIPAVLLMVNVLSSVLMQKRLIMLLYLDPVTGGKNWLHFVQKSRKILSWRRNSGTFFVVVNLHMDRYQEYCICYGSSSGEEIQAGIHTFLQDHMEKKENFARFDNADFALLLQCESMEQCKMRLKNMLEELAGIKNDRTLSYRAGVYRIDIEAQKRENGKKWRKKLDIDQFYHYANAARESLYGKEGESIGIFDGHILKEQLWKHQVEERMETALLNHEFQMYLQPKYSPVSSRLAGAEALVRWNSPTEGIIPPGRFIPIFEENGFITRLDDYMIAEVAKLQAQRRRKGLLPVIISVNVSRANFTKENLAQHICHLIDDFGADHFNIELEVTESAFFGDKKILQKTVKELKSYGFRISMDDFGAGYSSLNSLKELPVDVLKLDMEFFRGEDTEKRGEIVVKEVIRLAKNLDMEIVAEGIERKEQVEFLASQECDMIQGYYFAKPMTIEEFEERVRQDYHSENN